MKNVTRHVGTLEIVSRMPNSTNGNPRYVISVDGTHCRTAVDSMLGYTVTKFDGKRVEAMIGTHRGFATLESLHAV